MMQASCWMRDASAAAAAVAAVSMMLQLIARLRHLRPHNAGGQMLYLASLFSLLMRDAICRLMLVRIWLGLNLIPRDKNGCNTPDANM